MTRLEGLPCVFVDGQCRMPNVVQDYGVDINGWHENNALFTGVYNEIVKIKDVGIEKYVEGFAYDQNAPHLPMECMTTNRPRRKDGLLQLWNEFLKDHMDVEKILDVGCGRGQMGIWFSTAGKQYIGIDVSIASLGFCISLLPCLKFKYREIPMPVYRQMIAEDLKFSDKEFDIVFTSHSLEHMHDLRKALDEQVRVGKILCGVMAAPRDVEDDGEHLYRIERDTMYEYLSGVCSEWSVTALELETIYWGVVG
jgi:SAM-dependent methyltransferase